jgi:IS30 family transposase
VRRLAPDGLAAWEQVIERGYEVYVAKDERSAYEGGATRRWLKVRPKGTDLSVHSADALAAVALTLNTRPRKTLGWRTPAEALDEVLQSAHTGSVATTS